MPHHVVIASPTGGVGRTTLVAQLAARLTDRGKRCLAVDLDPQNALSLHLGGHPAGWVGSSIAGGQAAGFAGGVGIVQPDLTGVALAEHLRARRVDVAHIPFGNHDRDARQRAEQSLGGASKLRARLGALMPPRCELVLIDTPAGMNAWAEAALSVANIVLVPIVAEPGCVAHLPAYEAYLQKQAPSIYPARVLYVFNLWDPTRALACDVFEVLRGAMPERILPRPVFDDEFLREQLAKGSTTAAEYPSQAEADLDELAQFVLDALATRAPSGTSAVAS